MNIAKNMEAIFIATAVIACAAIYSPTNSASSNTEAKASAFAAAAVPTQTVIVKTKRMTAAEKAAYAL